MTVPDTAKRVFGNYGERVFHASRRLLLRQIFKNQRQRIAHMETDPNESGVVDNF
jgi:hypothetical protein